MTSGKRLVILFFGLFALALCGSTIVQNYMTTLGDLIYGGVNGTPTRLPGNTAAVMKFLAQTGTGSASAAPSWQVPPTSGKLVYYFTNTASDISTYLQATAAPFSPKTTKTYSSLAAGTDTLQNWATNAGVPGLTFIPAGAYGWHVHAQRTGTNGTVTLQAQFWEVSAVGVDIALIGTSEASNPLTTSETEHDLFFVDANTYTLTSAASRIVARVQAVVTTATTPNVEIFVGGTADSSLSLPSNTVDATNFVPYTGATTNVALGAHGITGAGFSGDLGSGGTSGLVPAPASGDAAAGKFLGAGGSWLAPTAQLHSISFVIDGGGSAIATGDAKVYPTAAFACTITRWDISADQAGDIAVDVWKAAGAIPTALNIISAAAPVAIPATNQLAQNGSVSTWTKTVAVGDVFGFNVSSATTVTRVVGQIWCQ